MSARKYGSTSFMSADTGFHYQRARAAFMAAGRFAESAPGLSFILYHACVEESEQAHQLRINEENTK